jgi:hypothetical protein
MKRLTFFEKLADGPVRTECLRIARNLVKEELKRQGIKVHHVEASEITAAAKHLISKDRSVFKQALVNLNLGPRRKP